jgi:hypothetical protein
MVRLLIAALCLVGVVAVGCKEEPRRPGAPPGPPTSKPFTKPATAK